MAKSFSKRLKNLCRESGRQLRRIWNREARTGEALSQIWGETRKLGRGATKAGGERSREAISLAKRGTQAYNKKDYLQAERLFCKALEEDPHYARAHTYLGNTYYKQGRTLEAAQSWHLAMRVEPDSDAAKEAQEKLMRMQQHRTQRLNDVIDELQR